MSISSTLDFSQFYELNDPLINRSLRITVRGYDDWVTSDYAWTLFRGQVSPEEPIKLGGFMGWKVTDFLWSDLVFIVGISSKVVEILSLNEVTGWATYPMDVYGRKSDSLPEYSGFVVTGNECRRDRSRSQVITKQAVPGGKPFQVYKGLYFCEEDWDGSDVFIIRRYGGIVVTEKVYKILKSAQVTNVMLTPLIEIERDLYLDKF